MTEKTKAIIGAVVVLVVQCAALAGYQLDADAVTEIVSAVVVLAVTVAAIWKNFNFTAAAAKGQAVTNALKAQIKAAEKGEVATKPEGLDEDTSAIDAAEEKTAEDGDE